MTSANQTPSSGPSTPYSREWREALTGRDLLNWAFPSVTEISEAAIEGIFCKKDENSIIPCSEIATLQTIPSAKNLLYAKRLIGELDTGARTRSHTNEGSWAVRIGSFGNFDKTTIKLLDPIVFEAMDMARGIREMLKWIGDNASSARDPFAVWFRDQLLNAPNIMQLSFRASTHVPLNLSSALFFRNEQYIDDEAIRLVLDLFSEHYTANNQYIFIPPLRIQQWTSSTKYNKSFLWKKEELESGRVEKAFAVVHMQHLDHWGAVQIDFINQELSFGDSLAMNCPITVESGIRKWLVACKIGENKWKRGMGLFRIARQPSTSGSCGIIALNAIEHAVNPSISLWEPQSAVEHRMRMLELVTAYSTVSSLNNYSILDMLSPFGAEGLNAVH
ncbi:hypothetical protein BCR41DRAFT_72808 [Lobosporangium transversale]|uniref:Ubiquitin-like protease family profile domain-containing protein n=1 Tax=Lobosporangium transversale TaxID=64571 RepID=A0A1Y2H1C9_9FUNG|nr:hypothetical protein BCR41DRAFT_72808 [Lobosporangium transversale]ORZ28358.1 hypothetical protein BCR41DRAFT_72808 [Lobosporangium transversale]|eukprot:XP_021886043.1 hypothetical protein BCR41DRAFT_72808 [Lobosporangium transversale]